MSEHSHSRSIVVWDVPSTVEAGETFSIKLGLKCASECEPAGWRLEIRDPAGKTQARTEPGDTPWPGTAALYYAEVKLHAPGEQGLYTWSAEAEATDLEPPHAACSASFGVRVVPEPECVLQVIAIDMQSRAPVRGAKVVVHPYRALTDERGVAQVKVPKGAYRVFVSGKDYVPFRTEGAAETDVTIRVELAIERGLSDADIWS